MLSEKPNNPETNNRYPSCITTVIILICFAPVKFQLWTPQNIKDANKLNKKKKEKKKTPTKNSKNNLKLQRTQEVIET